MRSEWEIAREEASILAAKHCNFRANIGIQIGGVGSKSMPEIIECSCFCSMAAINKREEVVEQRSNLSLSFILYSNPRDYLPSSLHLFFFAAL